MDKLRLWFQKKFLEWVRGLLVWALTKLAVAGIDEANGEQLGKAIKAKVPEPILKSVDGYLGEVRVGLRS